MKNETPQTFTSLENGTATNLENLKNSTHVTE